MFFLNMLYTRNQTFDSIGISVLLDKIKTWNESTMSKMSKTIILDNNCAEKLIKNSWKNHCWINY